MKKVAKTILIAMFSGSIGLSNMAMGQIPILIKDLYPGNGGAVDYITESNNVLFFAGETGQYGTELYKTDGTDAGTVLVKDIWPGQSWYSMPNSLTDVNGVLFFSAKDGNTGRELWKSDGTEAGTVLVKDINPTEDGIRDGASFINVNGTLFFIADDATTGYELWKSDGTASGTVLVKDINPSSSESNIQQLTAVNGTLYFTADNGVNGRELWKSDGTTGGTVMIKDIKSSGSGIPESSFSYLCVLNNTLYFAANDGTNGLEIWKSDGTESGTTMAIDIFPGSSGSLSGARLFVFNNFLFFDATDGSQTGLWKSDGTSAGTEFIKANAHPGGWYYGGNTGFASIGNTLFFLGNGITSGGDELWKTDGTTAGTMIVKDIKPGTAGSQPDLLTVVGDTLYFRASSGGTGSELWKSDGTETGTVNVSYLYCKKPNYLTPYKGALVFKAYNTTVGAELWRVGELTTVGIDQVENPISVNLFPNPSSGKFTCISSRIFSEIRIYNVSGKTVYTEKIHSQNTEIDLTNQPKGVYFYQLMDGYQKVETGKIIIE